MSLLGRLGNVGAVLLEQRLKDEESQRAEGDLMRRQQALQQSGILGEMAKTIGGKVLSGDADIRRLSPEMQAMLADYGNAAPTDEMKTGAVIGEMGKAASPDKVLGRDEVIAAMQAKGLPTADRWDLSKPRQFSDAEGTIGGTEEGLLPAFTRGAYEERPGVTQATTAANSIKNRLQQGVDEATQRQKAQEQSNYDITHPNKTPGTITRNTKGVMTRADVLDPQTGQMRPFNPKVDDINKIDWKEANEQQPNASFGAGVVLDTTGLDMAAKMYAKTAQLPPLGMGASAAKLRSDIINRAATYNPTTDTFSASNVSPDLASNKAEYGAGSQALTSLTRNYNAVSAFHNTVKKNSAVLQETMKGMPDTGVPIINAPYREVLQQVGGNTQLAAYNALRQSVQNEYARIINQPTLVGVLSDTARKEMETILSPTATVSQISAALAALEQEAGNREVAFRDQLTAIKSGIRQGAGGGAQTPAETPEQRGARLLNELTGGR